MLCWAVKVSLPKPVRGTSGQAREPANLRNRLSFVADVDGDKKDDDPYDNPLRRTNTPFGGMINDVRRRAPHYKSDFSDGFNCQCFSAAIFMYFAALSAAITFGGLFG